MMIPPRMVSPSSIRRTRMRSWSGVKVVVADVDAIASLLLQVPGRVGARPRVSWVYKKKARKVRRQTENLLPSNSAKQFCRQGASSQAFQLLTIGKGTVV